MSDLHDIDNSETPSEADIARGVGEEMKGAPIAFVELAWEELIPALKGDRIDVIMSGMSVTPVRQHRVRFVQPYLASGRWLLFGGSCWIPGSWI